MSLQERLKALRNLRKQLMPTSEEVVKETLDRLGYSVGISPAQARSQFNSMLRCVFEETLVVLEEHEQSVDANRLLPELVSMRMGEIQSERLRMKKEGDDAVALQSAVVRLLKSWHELLRGFFLTVAQSRKARGGKDFEYQIRFLLKLAQVPYEMQPLRERADFILPSSSMLYTERPRAVVLSVKRTLRERWQEVVDELQRMQCPNTHLATADENIPRDKVNAIKQRNIYLVVWDEVKASMYGSEAMVLGYSDFMARLESQFLPFWSQ